MANLRGRKRDLIEADIRENRLSAESGDEKAERVAIYCRVSSEKQKDEQTIKVQHSITMEFLEKNLGAHKFVGLYMDEAYNAERYSEGSDLARLLSDVRSGKVSFILVYRLDRIFRSVSSDEFRGAIKDVFNKYGVTVIESDGARHEFGSGDAGKRVINSINEQFSVQNKIVMASRQASGRWRRVKEFQHLYLINAPFGYRQEKQMVPVSRQADGHGKTRTVKRSIFRLRLVAGEAAIVKDIFRLYTGLEAPKVLQISPSIFKKRKRFDYNQQPDQGIDETIGYAAGERGGVVYRYNPQHIAEILDANNVCRLAWARAQPSAKEKRGGSQWTRESVKRILFNSTYTGELEIGVSKNAVFSIEAELIVIPVPKIIDSDMFRACRVVATSQTPRMSPGDPDAHPLSGVIKCLDCLKQGRTAYLRGKKSTKTSSKSSYICRAQSGHRSFDGDLLERRFLGYLLDNFFGNESHSLTKEKLFSAPEEDKSLKTRLLKRKEQIDKQLREALALKKLWTEMVSDGSMSRDEFREFSASQDSDKMALEARLLDVENKLTELEARQNRRGPGERDLQEKKFKDLLSNVAPILKDLLRQDVSDGTEDAVSGESGAFGDLNSAGLASKSEMAWGFLSELISFVAARAEITLQDDPSVLGYLDSLESEEARQVEAIRLYANGYLSRLELMELAGLTKKQIDIKILPGLKHRPMRRGMEGRYLIQMHNTVSGEVHVEQSVTDRLKKEA